MLILFYISLVVCICTIVVVAIKGFMELLAPIRAAKRDAQKKKDVEES